MKSKTASFMVISALIAAAMLPSALYGGNSVTVSASGPIADKDGFFLVYDVEDLSRIGNPDPAGYEDWTLNANYRLANDITFRPFSGDVNDPDYDNTNGGVTADLTISYDDIDKTFTVTVTSDKTNAASIYVWLGTENANSPSGTVTISAPADAKTYKMVIGGMVSGEPYAYAADIDMSDPKSISTRFDSNGNFTPIGIDYSKMFKGTFDGNGYEISGMNTAVFATSNQYAGMFGCIETSSVYGLGMAGGYAVAVSAGGQALAGGIAGRTDGTITDCYNTSDISASSTSKLARAGGITGQTENSIDGCYNTGDISALSSASESNIHTNAGGIAGNSGKVTNCYNTGDISASAINHALAAGGIAGNTTAAISSCYNTGDISTSSLATSGNINAVAGGIAGRAYVQSESITNCYNTGNVNAASERVKRNSYAGGIVGWIDGYAIDIENCYNIGSISASSLASAYAGGIAGSILTSSVIAHSFHLQGVDPDNIRGNTNGDISTSAVLSSDQLQDKDQLSDWDFTAIWDFMTDVNGNYPILQAFIFNITLNDDGNGMIEGPDTVYSGTRSELKIVPDNEYRIEKLTSTIGNNVRDITSRISSNGILDISNIFNDTEFSASFEFKYVELTIFVKDDLDVPISGAIVIIGTDTKTTDINGTTKFAVVKGDTITAEISKPGFVTNIADVTPVSDMVLDVVMNRNPDITMSVKVIDGGGNPIMDANMIVSGEDKGMTDPDGIVTFHVQDGLEITIHASKYGRTATKTVFASATTEHIMIADILTVTVSVTDTAGDPAEGASVTVNGENKGTTNSNGIRTFQSPEGLELNVSVSKDGYVTATKTVFASAAAVDIVLQTETNGGCSRICLFIILLLTTMAISVCVGIFMVRRRDNEEYTK